MCKSEYFYADVSAYCACKRCCGPGAKGIMANGKKVHSGAVAAPNTFSFGTKLYIPQYGKVSVEDRGGAIKNAGSFYKGTYLRYTRLDLYFPTHKQALNWGRKVLKVRILENGHSTEDVKKR